MISKIYSKQVFYWDLMNNLFYFENSKQSKLDIQLNSLDLIDKKSINNAIKSRTHSKLYSGLKDICQFFFMRFMQRKSKNYNYYNNGTHKLNKILDFSYIIKTIRQTI